MQALGMNGMEYLASTDPIFRMTAEIVFEKTRKEVDKMDTERAAKIASKVSRLFK